MHSLMFCETSFAAGCGTFCTGACLKWHRLRKTRTAERVRARDKVQSLEEDNLKGVEQK